MCFNHWKQWEDYVEARLQWSGQCACFNLNHREQWEDANEIPGISFHHELLSIFFWLTLTHIPWPQALVLFAKSPHSPLPLTHPTTMQHDNHSDKSCMTRITSDDEDMILTVPSTSYQLLANGNFSSSFQMLQVTTPSPEQPKATLTPIEDVVSGDSPF